MYVFELFQFKTRENVCEREGDKMWNELRTWWRDYLEHVKSQPTKSRPITSIHRN